MRKWSWSEGKAHSKDSHIRIHDPSHAMPQTTLTIWSPASCVDFDKLFPSLGLSFPICTIRIYTTVFQGTSSQMNLGYGTLQWHEERHRGNELEI